MAGELPAHARATAAVAMIDDLTTAESSVLTAAIRWVNFKTGELWPSVGEWTRTARVSARGFHKIIRRLAVRGLVEVVKATKGGRGSTTIYRIPALAVNNPALECGVSAPETPHQTPHSDEGNPALEDTKPRTGDHNPALGTGNPAQLVRTNIEEQPRNHRRQQGTPSASAVDSGLTGEQRAVFEYLTLAEVGRFKATELAMNGLTMADARRVNDARKVAGKPADGKFVAQLKAAAAAAAEREKRRRAMSPGGAA